MQPAPTYVLTTREADRRRVAAMAVERARRIGRRMRERRDELDLTQTEVAARIGTSASVSSVTKDYVSRWETGKVDASLGSYMPHIAAALETTETDLMAGPHTDRKPQGPTPALLDMAAPANGGSQLDRIERLLLDLREQLSEHGESQPGRRRRNA